MPMFLCRWSNGGCSAVWARDEQDAISRLDEVGDAQPCEIGLLPEFQVHFRLTNDGSLGLDDLGDETEPAIWRMAYPLLDQVEMEVMEEREASGADELTAAQRERIRQAVAHERERMSPVKPVGPVTMVTMDPAEDSTSPRGRYLQAGADAATRFVDEMIRDAGAVILRKLKRPGKIN
jgi:hypothetical protein